MNARKEFTARVDKLEARFKGDPINRYVTSYLMPRDLMVKLRDELRPKAVRGRERLEMLPGFEGK